jgi:hypothetical protein
MNKKNDSYDKTNSGRNAGKFWIITPQRQLEFKHKNSTSSQNVTNRHSAKATQKPIALFIDGHEPPVSSRQSDETIQAAATLGRILLIRDGV